MSRYKIGREFDDGGIWYDDIPDVEFATLAEAITAAKVRLRAVMEKVYPGAEEVRADQRDRRTVGCGASIMDDDGDRIDTVHLFFSVGDDRPDACGMD
jgi:hypothetical protein